MAPLANGSMPPVTLRSMLRVTKVDNSKIQTQRFQFGSDLKFDRVSKFLFEQNLDFVSGIKTGQDARFFGISTKFEPFSNKGKDLVIQYQMKHTQNIDCGGGYIKV